MIFRKNGLHTSETPVSLAVLYAPAKREYFRDKTVFLNIRRTAVLIIVYFQYEYNTVRVNRKTW